MIATPAYGGGMHTQFVRSLLALQKTLMVCGIEHQFNQIYNESLISRARNGLAQQFLASDCTDLIFIDADIEFDPADVVALMHFDKELIGGAYPLKKINWDAVRAAVAKNPEIPAEALKSVGCFYASHLLDGSNTMRPFEPLEAEELATGFMLVKREVFEALQPHVPTYFPVFSGEKDRPVHWDYVQVGVHEGRYESEDYSFCRKWRELGGKIYMCPWMKLTHHGNYPFPGNMKAQADYLGQVY